MLRQVFFITFVLMTTTSAIETPDDVQVVRKYNHNSMDIKDESSLKIYERQKRSILNPKFLLKKLKKELFYKKALIGGGLLAGKLLGAKESLKKGLGSGLIGSSIGKLFGGGGGLSRKFSKPNFGKFREPVQRINADIRYL